MIGIAINTISTGCETIVSAWNANSRTTVARRPIIDVGFRRAVKRSTAPISPAWPAMTARRVNAPAASGTTT